VLTTDQRWALRVLAISAEGCTVRVLTTHGLNPDLLVGLVSDGLASMEPKTVRGESASEVRVRITDAGRQALARE
jgi:hypothetical protein